MTDISRVVRYTSKGLAELVSAKNQGLKGAVTHIGAGTANYNPPADGSQLALKAEKQRVAISDYEDLGAGSLRMVGVFRGDLEYPVGEYGFYLESGTLLAVYSVAGQLLNYKAATAVMAQKFTLDLTPLPTDSVTVEVGEANLNILMTDEIATLATANIANMARHVNLMLRVMELEAK